MLVPIPIDIKLYWYECVLVLYIPHDIKYSAMLLIATLYILSTMKCGDKYNCISILQDVIQLSQQLPISVIY